MPYKKSYKGLRHAVGALKELPPDQQSRLIKNLIAKDPDLARQLQEGLFEFEDIANLARADFKFLWFEIPRKTWLLSLRTCTPELAKFIQSCLTQRAYNELVEDLKENGPQPLSAVMQAQKELLDEIRALAKQGRIHLPQDKK